MICKFNTSNNNKKVIWEITNRCNFKCQYCIFNTRENFNELSYDNCIKIIDELIKNDFDYIKFTGGEPFIRKDFINILKYANNKINFDISTNASLIDENVIKELTNININFIHISLDGIKNNNDFMRGKDSFEKTINGIKLLKNSGKYIRIGCVLFKENENNIEEFIKLLEDLNVDEVIFSIMEPFGILNGDLKHYVSKSTKELEDILLNTKSKIKISYNWNSTINDKINTCPAGKKILFIDNNGNVSPCTWISKISDKYNLSLQQYSLSNILKEYNINSNFCIYDKEIKNARNK